MLSCRLLRFHLLHSDPLFFYMLHNGELEEQMALKQLILKKYLKVKKELVGKLPQVCEGRDSLTI